MGKKRRILVAALILAALGGILWIWCLRGKPEPVYQGKRLSAWLQECLVQETDSSHSQQAWLNASNAWVNASNAVYQARSNAIPPLLRMLRAKDSALKLKELDWLEKLHLPQPDYTYAAEINDLASSIFGALGAEGKYAVPELMKIFDENISIQSRLSVLSSLAAIGPPAKDAVPMLVHLATNSNYSNTFVPGMRGYACWALGQIRARPEMAVPALTNCLCDHDYNFRKTATRSLSQFGGEAEPAIPMLLELLHDPIPVVRSEAVKAIKQIDPAAAELRKAELDAAAAPGKE